MTVVITLLQSDYNNFYCHDVHVHEYCSSVRSNNKISAVSILGLYKQHVYYTTAFSCCVQSYHKKRVEKEKSEEMRKEHLQKSEQRISLQSSRKISKSPTGKLIRAKLTVGCAQRDGSDSASSKRNLSMQLQAIESSAKRVRHSPEVDNGPGIGTRREAEVNEEAHSMTAEGKDVLVDKVLRPAATTSSSLVSPQSSLRPSPHKSVPNKSVQSVADLDQLLYMAGLEVRSRIVVGLLKYVLCVFLHLCIYRHQTPLHVMHTTTSLKSRLVVGMCLSV